MLYHQLWPIINDNMIACVQAFFHQGYMMKELKIDIVLTPKNRESLLYK